MQMKTDGHGPEIQKWTAQKGKPLAKLFSIIADDCLRNKLHSLIDKNWAVFFNKLLALKRPILECKGTVYWDNKSK